jgi:hypothetical protein
MRSGGARIEERSRDARIDLAVVILLTTCPRGLGYLPEITAPPNLVIRE